MRRSDARGAVLHARRLSIEGVLVKKEPNHSWQCARLRNELWVGWVVTKYGSPMARKKENNTHRAAPEKPGVNRAQPKTRPQTDTPSYSVFAVSWAASGSPAAVVLAWPNAYFAEPVRGRKAVRVVPLRGVQGKT